MLFPVAQWITRSSPRDLDLFPDGLSTEPPAASAAVDVGRAVRSTNFCLIRAGCTLTIGAIGGVTQHLILFLKAQGYSLGAASRVSSSLLVSSLAGRVLVGYVADRYSRKNVMALFYLLLALAIPLLFAVLRHPAMRTLHG